MSDLAVKPETPNKFQSKFVKLFREYNEPDGIKAYRDTWKSARGKSDYVVEKEVTVLLGSPAIRRALALPVIERDGVVDLAAGDVEVLSACLAIVRDPASAVKERLDAAKTYVTLRKGLTVAPQAQSGASESLSSWLRDNQLTTRLDGDNGAE